MKDWFSWVKQRSVYATAGVIGKGPSFSEWRNVDMPAFTVGLNHVVRECPVTVAHAVDLDVIDQVPRDAWERNCEVLAMPWRPHVDYVATTKTLDDFVRENETLASLASQGRLVWYNLFSGRKLGHRAGCPEIGVRFCSSEAVFNLLGASGIREIRTLGIDGGKEYAAEFQDRNPLASGLESFSLQSDELERIARKRGIRVLPMRAANRLVGVWDFYRQSGHIGDFVVFLANLSLIASDEGYDTIDIVFVADERSPRRHNPRWTKTVENRLAIMSLVDLLPNLGTVHVCRSQDEWRRLVVGRRMFPQTDESLAYGWKSYPGLFYRSDVPSLWSTQPWIDEALEFIARHAGSRRQVAFNIRHSHRMPHRNANPVPWKDAMREICDAGYHVFLVGTAWEADQFRIDHEKFTAIPDHRRELLFDAAMLQCVDLSVHSGGGMEFIAALTGSPLLTFQDHLASPHPANRLTVNDGPTPRYLGTHQRHVPSSFPTAEIIVENAMQMLKSGESSATLIE